MARPNGSSSTRSAPSMRATAPGAPGGDDDEIGAPRPAAGLDADDSAARRAAGVASVSHTTSAPALCGGLHQVRHRAVVGARRHRWGRSGRCRARRAPVGSCRRSSAGRRCDATPSCRCRARASACTARGVRPSPHTLSRPGRRLLEDTHRRAGPSGADRCRCTGRAGADDDDVAVLHGLQSRLWGAGTLYGS